MPAHSRIGMAVLIIVALLAFGIPARAQTGRRCFVETSYCIEGRIREFWEQNGGLPVFGLPITPQHEEQVEGKAFQTQWFERNRLELHPENERPYDVLIGRIGDEMLTLADRDWHDFPSVGTNSGCHSFPVTGHRVCGLFRSYWESHGLEIDGQPGVSERESLALFGLPLSDVMLEEIEGVLYRVQWFERARFELHPENEPPYDVLLGLLGTEVYTARLRPDPTPPTPTASVTPTPSPTRRPRRDDPAPTKTPAPTNEPAYPEPEPYPEPAPTDDPAPTNPPAYP